MEVSWIAPYDSASPILSYLIYIRHADEVSYSLELSHCDGNEQTIVDTQSCIIPISVIRDAPFYLEWGTSVFAKIVAKNAVDSSHESAEGNGAMIVTVPDAPINLENVDTVTNGD